ncbi:MAG TPA: ArsA family ATPase [Thermoanaerobaculia bacterium]|jgi:arsenite-transporting ATPase
MSDEPGGRSSLISHLSSLSTRRVVLFGGKGGVGKTTLSSRAALHFAETRRVILFTTDPASNLGDLALPASLTVESVDAETLYSRFLSENLANLLEIGDRGTYLDREELRRFFELSLPGIDELMSWMRIGELAEANPDALIVVDTAPTGHTLRMLSSAEHFAQFAEALDAMQEKHRAMVRQFTRRDVRDALDTYIYDFADQAKARRELLNDPARAAFIPVLLSEPWVVEQTVRLIAEVREEGIDVPFAVLNRAVLKVDCPLDERRAQRDAEAREKVGVPVADLARFCEEAGVVSASTVSVPQGWAGIPHHTKLTFFAGKGGVGKTTTSSSIALQLAQANPRQKYTLISVDPAHSLRDVFAHESPPPNLTVETIDTRAKWRRFRQSLGGEIERAVEGLAPGGFSLSHDTEAMRRLLDVAPPGADEIFAITRLADLIGEETQVLVDTAPTGHFLRLLDLPKSAGEWVRELMRILLNYRDLVAPGSLGEELVNASRAFKELDATMKSERTTVIVVTRPEPIVVAETRRLIAAIEERGLRVGGIVANYVTPENECACDRGTRAGELAALAPLGENLMLIERRDEPVTRLAELATLVPIH